MVLHIACGCRELDASVCATDYMHRLTKCSCSCSFTLGFLSVFSSGGGAPGSNSRAVKFYKYIEITDERAVCALTHTHTHQPNIATK